MSETNERSVASPGSVADEPAAWGVLRVGGGWVSILANEVQAETSRKSWDARENWVHEVVPLYRSPMLTDDEQEALKHAEWTLREIVDATCDKAAATLLALLERLSDRPQPIADCDATDDRPNTVESGGDSGCEPQSSLETPATEDGET